MYYNITNLFRPNKSDISYYRLSYMTNSKATASISSLDDNSLSGILLQTLHRNPDYLLQSKLDRLSADEWLSLVELAIEHRVAPQFQESLGDIELPPVSQKAVNNLSGYNKQVAFNNLRFSGELRKLIAALNTEDIPLIPLKGMYLAEAVYSNRGLREMNDIDILIPLQHMQRAYDILKELGYTSEVPQDIPSAVKSKAHLAPMIKRQVAVFEVHWNIVKPGSYGFIEPDSLWDRSQLVDFAGEPCRALSPEDLLLHLCWHTSYQHNFSFGLRPFCDISQVITHFDQGLNWDTVVDIAKDNKWQRGVCLALILSKNFLGADVPDEVLDDLKPSEFSDDIVETATSQVLTEKKLSASVPSSIVDLARGNSIRHKIRSIWTNIFLSRQSMANLYEVPRTSPKIYGFYITRMIRISSRYLLALAKMPYGGRKFGRILSRKKSLHSWITNES